MRRCAAPCRRRRRSRRRHLSRRGARPPRRAASRSGGGGARGGGGRTRGEEGKDEKDDEEEDDDEDDDDDGGTPPSTTTNASTTTNDGGRTHRRRFGDRFPGGHLGRESLGASESKRRRARVVGDAGVCATRRLASPSNAVWKRRRDARTWERFPAARPNFRPAPRATWRPRGCSWSSSPGWSARCTTRTRARRRSLLRGRRRRVFSEPIDGVRGVVLAREGSRRRLRRAPRETRRRARTTPSTPSFASPRVSPRDATRARNAPPAGRGNARRRGVRARGENRANDAHKQHGVAQANSNARAPRSKVSAAGDRWVPRNIRHASMRRRRMFGRRSRTSTRRIARSTPRKRRPRTRARARERQAEDELAASTSRALGVVASRLQDAGESDLLDGLAAWGESILGNPKTAGSERRTPSRRLTTGSSRCPPPRTSRPSRTRRRRRRWRHTTRALAGLGVGENESENRASRDASNRASRDASNRASIDAERRRLEPPLLGLFGLDSRGGVRISRRSRGRGDDVRRRDRARDRRRRRPLVSRRRVSTPSPVRMARASTRRFRALRAARRRAFREEAARRGSDAVASELDAWTRRRAAMNSAALGVWDHEYTSAEEDGDTRAKHSSRLASAPYLAARRRRRRTRFAGARTRRRNSSRRRRRRRDRTPPRRRCTLRAAAAGLTEPLRVVAAMGAAPTTERLLMESIVARVVLENADVPKRTPTRFRRRSRFPDDPGSIHTERIFARGFACCTSRRARPVRSRIATRRQRRRAR